MFCYNLDIFLVCSCYSNRSHFGLIQSMGGGKYVCHVFAEYKVSTTGSDMEDVKPASCLYDLVVFTFSIEIIRLVNHNFVVCVFAEVCINHLYWCWVLIGWCDCFQLFLAVILIWKLLYECDLCSALKFSVHQLSQWYMCENWMSLTEWIK